MARHVHLHIICGCSQQSLLVSDYVAHKVWTTDWPEEMLAHSCLGA